MRTGFYVILVAMVALVAGETLAADRSSSRFNSPDVTWRSAPAASRAASIHQPPFPVSQRERAVRAELVCWSNCQSVCTDRLDRCLAGYLAQGRCLAAADRCDRLCQSDCRRRGGPLIEPIPR
jgi:hypothetical protein